MRHVLPAALALALVSCRTPPPAQPAKPPAQPPRAEAPAAPAPPLVEAPPLLQLPPGVRPLRYALDLEVVPGRAEGFRGTCAIEIELDAARPYVWLHGRGLRVSSAEVEVPGAGRLAAAFAQVNEDGLAKVTFARTIGPGRATLRFAFEASWDERLAGLYLSRAGGEIYASTQLEPIFARRVFPSFDEPRFKTPFDVSLTVPDGATAVSNAPVASERPAREGLRTVRFATTEPLPTYLLFVGVGPFDVVTPPPLPPNEVRERPLAVRLLAPKGHGQELGLAAEATAAIVPWFERYFAIPFPYAKLDQIAVPEFGGAMENAGAIAYRSALLLESAGTSEDDRRAIASVMAHEIAHEWLGDLVTLPWWTDTWLNEAFATWAGEKAEEAWRPAWKPLADAFRDVDRVMAVDAAASARAIRQPLRAMSDVFNQFDGMSYQKGAAVLRTFERFMGEERFRGAIRAYLADHRHGTGSADALFADLSRAAGLPLQEALSGFTDRPGVPLVEARVSCEPGRARLLLAQRRFVPRGSDARGAETWRLPVCARWEAGGALKEGCAFLDGQREGALELGAACPAWVMPHAGGASYHRWMLAPPDLARLRRAGLPRLTTIEKVSLARNVRAAQQVGGSPWGDAMAAIADLASDPDPDAALEPAPVLAEVHDRLVPRRSQPAVEAFARRLYAPVAARLGWTPRAGESLGTRRLREETLDLLALV
ncbi:MAG TPA: M1 family metallopeptidase, partial [Anaeromyxobacter sp.]|nr:M1 family metallopeptidase [Anaeromyxobacter sp.]